MEARSAVSRGMKHETAERAATTHRAAFGLLVVSAVRPATTRTFRRPGWDRSAARHALSRVGDIVIRVGALVQCNDCFDVLSDLFRLKVITRGRLAAPVDADLDSVALQNGEPLVAELLPRDLMRLESGVRLDGPDDSFDPRPGRPERLRTMPARCHRRRKAALIANCPEDSITGHIPIEGRGLRSTLGHESPHNETY